MKVAFLASGGGGYIQAYEVKVFAEAGREAP